MRRNAAKISLFIFIGIVFFGCETLKYVPADEQLLVDNEIIVNGEKETSEDVTNQLYQKPNSNILGYKLRLNLYNLANLKHDSTYNAKFVNNPEKYRRMSKILSAKQVNRLGQSFWYAGINDFLRETGEPPVIVSSKSAEKSARRLRSYYFNRGYFKVKTDFEIDSAGKQRAEVKYDVKLGDPYYIDTIKVTIDTKALDSMYNAQKSASLIKTGKKYMTADFENERNRITTQFRNNGVYQFQQNFITYDLDTISTGTLVNVNLKITDNTFRQGDSTVVEPFKIYKISRINIFTGYGLNKEKSKYADSVEYKDFNIYSRTKLKYRPKAITDAVFLSKNNLFADFRTTLTTRYLSNLRIFNYPTVQYEVDTNDTINSSLIANIFLTPKKKYGFTPTFDVTHSNIQPFGLAANSSVLIRNVFNGAETLELGLRGAIGTSKSFANPNDNFFNVSEYGFDGRLNFPRVLMFFGTEKIIPKSMIPSTAFNLGYAKQQNIGLDKENFTSSLVYIWTPKRNATGRFDLFNVQYVKNINIANYFRVYTSSYRTLTTIADSYSAPESYFFGSANGVRQLTIEDGTNTFIADVLGQNPSVLLSDADRKKVKSINERKRRLTEDNLIFASSISYSQTTKADLIDENFYAYRAKFESAGNILSLLSKIRSQKQNEIGNNTIFDVAYSQYLKGEGEFVKHWDFRRKKVVAIRAFAGLAVPYGNSNSIPFSRSYFAGGSNDNRAWQPYALGPGRTGAVNDFNEANLKLAFSTEFRFNYFGKLNGALFVDTGNIWNVLDNTTDEAAKFEGFKSLADAAVGSGFGFRYDLSFFVIRVDLGFKTYNPGAEGVKKWFRDYNFSNSVINLGINYPF